MSTKTSDISKDHDSAFLQENRQKLVQSIADQIYNTIVSKSANDDKGKDYYQYKINSD